MTQPQGRATARPAAFTYAAGRRSRALGGPTPTPQTEEHSCLTPPRPRSCWPRNTTPPVAVCRTTRAPTATACWSRPTGRRRSRGYPLRNRT
jgi:hypothetical protein